MLLHAIARGGFCRVLVPSMEIDLCRRSDVVDILDFITTLNLAVGAWIPLGILGGLPLWLSRGFLLRSWALGSCTIRVLNKTGPAHVRDGHTDTLTKHPTDKFEVTLHCIVLPYP